MLLFFNEEKGKIVVRSWKPKQMTEERISIIGTRGNQPYVTVNYRKALSKIEVRFFFFFFCRFCVSEACDVWMVVCMHDWGAIERDREVESSLTL